MRLVEVLTESTLAVAARQWQRSIRDRAICAANRRRATLETPTAWKEPAMETRQLRYVVLLAETLHFGRAAELAYISQPAFSQQIARLERELGTRLFDRSSNRVRLTPAGELLVERATRLLAELDAAEAQVRRVAEGAAGALRVGVFADGAGELTPLLLSHFRRASPETKLVFRELSMTTQLEALTDGAVDVAILRAPIRHPDVELHALFAEPRMAILPRGHALASRAEVSVEDLVDEPFVTAADDAPVGWGAFWRCDADRGRPGRVVAEMTSVEEGLAGVAYLGAVDTCPSATARHYAHPGVAYVPLRDGAYATVAVAHRRGDDRPAVSAFCTVATEVARRRLSVVPTAVAPADAPIGTPAG
jgi:DNA-binding transcriptional LysR family regulator